MADVLLLERHVLASPSTAYDTAWSTYGWTEGIRGRVGRLEEEVPWGTHVARAADPPRLSGPAEVLLRPANLDRLGSAVLPVDGWLGFALWGAGTAGEGGGERRVLTHTLLFTEEDFRRVGGHPEGLLRIDGQPAPWFRDLVERRDFREPTVLEPVRLSLEGGTAAALARARLEELDRLRRAVLAGFAGDTDRLASTVASMYEALARRSWEGGVDRVVVRGVGAATSRLLRLVWLSLPLEDRVRVSWVTEQRRSERPRARLLGLPEAEWGRYVPDGSWVLGEHEPFEAGAGRTHWARMLAAPDSLEGFRRLDARAAARGWRLVTGDDVEPEGRRGRWERTWRTRGPSLEGVRALYELEEGRPGGPRVAAVGSALGEALAGAPEGAAGEEALEAAVALVSALPSRARVPLLRGAVRALREQGGEGLRRAALLRCRAAGSGDPDLAAELHRLVDRESDALRALLADPSGAGGPVLLAGALPLASAGDPVGRELVRLGAGETRWTPERVEELEAALGPAPDGSAGAYGWTLADILATLVREGHDAPSVAAAAGALLPRMDGDALGLLGGSLTALATPSADPAAFRELAVAVLVRWAGRGGGDGDEARSALLSRLLAAAPPSRHPEPWRRLVSEAPATWLGRSGTLGRLVEGLEAGRHPFGRANASGASEATGELASTLARRVLEQTRPTGLGPEGAEAVLRLMWAAGSDEALTALEPHRSARLPVLAELLTVPAPLPLFHRLRARLVAALETDPPGRSLDPWLDALNAWAPGVAVRLGDPAVRSPRIFVGVGP
ncbi:MAG TPA: hypothetical protein VE173_06980 [Longimicrobiales bacterium]|nr:hypothetical protein [Longimicrobiales bacterium]